jgi:hypothetical protein
MSRKMSSFSKNKILSISDGTHKKAFVKKIDLSVVSYSN